MDADNYHRMFRVLNGILLDAFADFNYPEAKWVRAL
jgi:hypothetical protein